MGSKNEVIAQLKRRLSQIELERTQLQDNVYDAEQTLRTAAKDREYLNIYVKALHAAFEKVRILNEFSCIEPNCYVYSIAVLICLNLNVQSNMSVSIIYKMQ